MRGLMLALTLALASPAAARLTGPPPSAVTTATTSTTTARPATDAALAAFVDGYVANAVDQLGLPSAAVVVVRDGRPILSKAYGYADYKTGRRATVDATIYRQASVSKLFTWLLVMQQVEAGKLDLDRDANVYLDFKLPDAFGKPITLRQLMTHSAGFDERVRGVFDPGPPQDLGKLLRENLPARVYPPGGTMAYSNYGAALAAYIVQRSAGRPILTLLQERILTPLGMTHSTFAQPLPASLAPLLAQGYLPGSRSPFEFEWVATPSAGGMSASAADLGRFMTMLLNGGSLDGVQIVRPETLVAMLEVVRPLGPGLPTGFGLGFEGGTEGGIRYMGHGGNLSTTATQLMLFPDQRFGVYLAFNGQGKNGAAGKVRDAIIPALIERLGGTAPAKPVAVAGSTAADVAGTYLSARRSHSGFLKFGDMLSMTDVTAGDDGAITVSGVERSDGSLRRWLPLGRDRFAEAESGSPLVFKRDADGKVRGMAGALVYPVAEFDRVGGWLPLLTTLLTVAFGVIVLTALSVPASALLRWSWNVRPPQRQPRRRWFGRARVGAWGIVVAGLAWLYYLSSAQDDIALLTSGAGVWLILLRALTLFGLVGAIMLMLDGFSVWGDRTRGLWRKSWATLAGLAAVVIAVAVFAFDLLLFSTSY